MPVRVFLIDNHALVRQALKGLLEREGFQVVGEADDGQQALATVPKVNPDIAIIDIGMPVLNGIDTARELQKMAPRTKSILLTRHSEEQYVSEALRLGVKGYVVKNQAANDLVEAIKQVSRGEFYLSPSISGAVVSAYRSDSDAPDPLTSRERQVLQLIGEGKTTKDIATLLGISERTAETHRGRLMRKLDIHETANLVRYAIRRGLIEA
jgi:DNA-binding NarL/FixJ family response regulator